MKLIRHSMLFVACFQTAVAQDMHFSQYSSQPSLVNPALTGVANSFRASVAYRDQWRSASTPYKTMGAFIESRFNHSNWEKADDFRSLTFKQKSVGRLAAGLSVYKDNAGDGSLQNTQANLSLASFVPTGRLSFLSLGVQASFVQSRVDNAQLIFPSQYNGSFYDPDKTSGENFQRNSLTYFDFGAGALWSYGFNEKRFLNNRELKATIGFSVFHLNRPNELFLLAGNNASFVKYVFHGELLTSLSDKSYAIIPSYLLQFRGSSKELMAGFTARHYLNFNSKYTGIVKRSSIGFGIYYRNYDALIITSQLQLKEQFTIGLSYDLNLSRLATTTNGRGGFEIVLCYTPAPAYLYQEKKEE